MKIERGDILMVNLGQVPGTSLQSGIRPVVVVSNNKAKYIQSGGNGSAVYFKGVQKTLSSDPCVY